MKQLFATVLLAVFSAVAAPAQADNPTLDALATKMNAPLASAGVGVEVGSIELFTIGSGRPADRILQNPERWVPKDARRHAEGSNLRYIVRQSLGNTSSGLANAQTESAIDA